MKNGDAPFHREVKRALAHFHDPSYLRKHSLTEWLPPNLAYGSARGKVLQQWLREAVDHLKPVGMPDQHPKAWRPYLVLYHRYIEGLTCQGTMRKLDISESELHRQQRQAIAAVADFLKEARAQARPPSVEVESVPKAKVFVGRREELGYYRDLLEDEHAVVLTGMAGVGKTTLGAELASLYTPERQVIWFAFRRGRNTNMESILEGLGLSLLAHGHGEYWRFLQADRQTGTHLAQETRIRYLVNCLTRGDFFLCFDNLELARDDAVIQSFLKDLLVSARTGRVWLLVMSRETPAFASGFPLRPLNGLSQENARQLLAVEGVTTLPEDIFARLYEKTRGLPVLLKLFAAWAQSLRVSGAEIDEIQEQVAAFVDHLLQQDNVRRYLLHEVYDTLTPTEQRLVQVVAAMRLHFTEEEGLFGVLAAEGIERVEQTVEDLTLRHVFTVDETGAWSLHPLIQEYCYRRLTAQPADKARVHGRLAAFYAEHRELLEAAYHYERAGEERQAVRLLAGGLEQLIHAGQGEAALNQLEQLAPQMGRAADRALCFELLAAREQLYSLFGQRKKQQAVLKRMLLLAEELGDEVKLAATHNRRSIFHEALGDYSAAIAAAEAAQEAARRAGDRSAEAESLNRSGMALTRQGDYEAAREQLEQALALAHAVGDRRKQATALDHLGIVCQDLEDYDAAERYQNESLAIWSALGDSQGTARSLNNLGIVHYERGDYERALGCLEQVLAGQRATGNRLGEATSLTNLGNIYLDLGHYKTGKDCHEQALRIHREIGERRGEGISLVDLGILHCFSGDYLAARDYCLQGLEIAQVTGNRMLQAYALTYLGIALEGLGDWTGARALHSQALAIRREIPQPAQAIDSLAGLARVELAQSNGAMAKGYTEEILAYLAAHGSAGVDYPIVVCHTCARVLAACGEDVRAAQTLQMGYALLMERANKISDPARRRSFLENVPAHRALLEASKN